VYPNPNNNKDNLEFNLERQDHYDMCKNFIRDNARVPIVEEFGKSTRQWRVHTCFEPCKQTAAVEPPFTIDERPICQDKYGKDQARASEDYILCLDPLKNLYEIF